MCIVYLSTLFTFIIKVSFIIQRIAFKLFGLETLVAFLVSKNNIIVTVIT